MSSMDSDNYGLDPDQAYLFVQALSQRAENAFGLPKNADAVVQPKHPPAIGSGIALQLTLRKPPINPTTGHVFGSSAESCDILLDTVTNRGVSSMAFSIRHERKSQNLTLYCLARNGIYFRNTQNAEMKKLDEFGQIYLSPGDSWIIVLGSIQIGLSTVERVPTQQKTFDQNLNGYMARVKAADPDFRKLNVPGSGPSIMETPATRVLTGIWDTYTAADRVGEGGNAFITACISKTGVTCCVKEAKQEASKKQLQQEMRSLRRVAHRSIVQYIDRDDAWTWVAIELCELGNLEEQHLRQPFTERETEVLIYQAVDALSHIHAWNMIHHDIKPFNILVHTRSENKVLVKIADFGSSCALRQRPNVYQGTPMYLPPECFTGPPETWGPKVDIWALGLVALRLFFGLPVQPPEPKPMSYYPESLYREGWSGSIQEHFETSMKPYLAGHQSPFFDTWSRMLRSGPQDRISALEASNKLREDYPSGYFFSLGKENKAKGERTPELIEPVLPKDRPSDDDSIFRFRALDVQGVQGISKPLLMLESCYFVPLTPILKARHVGKKGDMEVRTRKIQEDLGRMYWKFKLPDRGLETYIRIEHALKLCEGRDGLQPLVDVLKKEKALLEKEKTPREGSEDQDSDNGWSPQLGLVEAIRTSDSIIAFTEEGRMLLVRPKDGFIYSPSVQAVIDKRLLKIDELGDVSAYMSLDGATVVPRILSHKDIVSLGAAHYISF